MLGRNIFKKSKNWRMKKFVIERSLPGASNLSEKELRNISQTFTEVANEMETPYSWIQSFITEDKIYCIHIAMSREAIREHSKIARFPINTINEVKIIIDPTTGST
jgi:Nickel responsive protein SCO4226-like